MVWTKLAAERQFFNGSDLVQLKKACLIAGLCLGSRSEGCDWQQSPLTMNSKLPLIKGILNETMEIVR